MPEDYLNMCHIFYYNFYVNFIQSTWIRPQQIFQTKILEMTSLVNHHPVNIIISNDIAMSNIAMSDSTFIHLYHRNVNLCFRIWLWLIRIW